MCLVSLGEWTCFLRGVIINKTTLKFLSYYMWHLHTWFIKEFFSQMHIALNRAPLSVDGMKWQEKLLLMFHIFKCEHIVYCCKKNTLKSEGSKSRVTRDLWLEEGCLCPAVRGAKRLASVVVENSRRRPIPTAPLPRISGTVENILYKPAAGGGKGKCAVQREYHGEDTDLYLSLEMRALVNTS